MHAGIDEIWWVSHHVVEKTNIVLVNVRRVEIKKDKLVTIDFTKASIVFEQVEFILILVVVC